MTAHRTPRKPGHDAGRQATMKKFSRATKASVLAAGLAVLPGCGDTITSYNNYYTYPDAGQTIPDGGQADSGEEEPSGKHKCSYTVVDTLSCDNPKIYASLKDGEALEIEGDEDHYRLLSFGEDPDGDPDVRILTFLDKDCEVFGQPISMEVGDEISGSSIEGEEPAKLVLVSLYDNLVEVELSLELLASGDLNQGEALVFDFASSEVKARLDDLSVSPADEPSSAILSFIIDDITVKHLDVPEGEAEAAVPDVMSVRAAEVAAGYTFGAKWASLEIYYCGKSL